MAREVALVSHSLKLASAGEEIHNPSHPHEPVPFSLLTTTVRFLWPRKGLLIHYSNSISIRFLYYFKNWPSVPFCYYSFSPPFSKGLPYSLLKPYTNPPPKLTSLFEELEAFLKYNPARRSHSQTYSSTSSLSDVISDRSRSVVTTSFTPASAITTFRADFKFCDYLIAKIYQPSNN